jgi:hypothetical protein
MHFHFVCTDCGVYGSISVGPEAGSLRCPRCSALISIEPTGDVSQDALHKPVDDMIASWVSEPGESAEERLDADNICPSCGLDGVMSCDSARGDTICPACMTVYWREKPRGYGTVACPGCARTVEFSDLDRGKTIICEGCKYFLGCLVPPEKHAYRAHRSWNLR